MVELALSATAATAGRGSSRRCARVPLGAGATVVDAPGRLDAFACWFELRDGADALTTAPTRWARGRALRATSWTQAVFYVDDAPTLAAGPSLPSVPSVRAA